MSRESSGGDDLLWNYFLFHEIMEQDAPQTKKDAALSVRITIEDEGAASDKNDADAPAPELPDDACKRVFLAAYPALAAQYSPEELDETYWTDLIRHFFETDPPLAIRLWRALLDDAGPRLARDRETAKYFLDSDGECFPLGWLENDADNADRARLFLDELEDDRFARQLYQSAFVGFLQGVLLALCHESGRMKLGEHLLALLEQNPLPQSEWIRPLASFHDYLYEGADDFDLY